MRPRREKKDKKNHGDFFLCQGGDKPFAARDQVVVHRKFGSWRNVAKLSRTFHSDTHPLTVIRPSFISYLGHRLGGSGA